MVSTSILLMYVAMFYYVRKLYKEELEDEMSEEEKIALQKEMEDEDDDDDDDENAYWKVKDGREDEV